MTKDDFFKRHFNDEYEDAQGNEFRKDLDDVIQSQHVDIQQVCDGVHVNAQYVGEVFQWLINNGYKLTK